MHMFVSAAVYRKDDGDFYVTFWTGPEAQRYGVLPGRSSWTVGRVSVGADGEDVAVGTSLATGALGSRLLRLAESIGNQRALFPLDMLERSE